MTETPVVTHRSRTAAVQKSTQFQFSEKDVPLEVSGSELQNLREKAWNIYRNQKLPASNEEAWRRTDLSKLDPGQFSLIKNGAEAKISTPPADILEPLTDKEHAGQIVLYGSSESVKVSKKLTQMGIVFSTISHLRKTNPDLLSTIIGKIVKPEENIFSSMVHTFGQDGVVLYVPANTKVDLPLHSVVWNSLENAAYLSHIIVVLEANSEVTYIHESASPEGNTQPAFHAGVVEIHVGDNAKLQFVELQSFGKNVWNFTNERARVEANGTIEWTFGAIGSHLTKNFTDLDLAGDGAVGKMSGFYFTNGKQHLDHDTQQNHLAPNTTSDLLFKGALLENSRSVWQGMIYVAPGAQKSDGYQANRNLILKKSAHADSLPGLEILADDVRCTHGATVGKIDPEEIFYLLSRGIPKKEAERLVVEGFFDPIMQRIPFEGVRNRFEQYIHDKMAV